MRMAIALCTSVFVLAAPAFAETYAWERDGQRPPVPMINLETRFLLSDGRPYQGVAHDGNNFWLSRAGDGGSQPPTLEEWSDQGTFLTSVEQGGVFTQIGLYDVTWCGTYLWGSECWWLRAYDTGGALQGYWFANDPPFSPANPVRAMCYAETNRFYVGGWGTHVYRGTWGGTWGKPSTTGWQQITPSVRNGTSGIALDPDNNALYT